MKSKETKERIHNQKLYYCNDDSLISEQMSYLELLYIFNHSRPSEQAVRSNILKQLFSEIGEDCYIEPPLHANWGGKNVHFGNSVRQF
jgi:galactoside O-acetyltransferase